jgi:hypothetical protein
VAGPYARGRRFDLRYTYYGQRNHLVLLARTLGPGSPYFRRYWWTALRDVRDDLRYGARSLLGSGRSTAVGRLRGLAGGSSRATVKVVGLLSGGMQVAKLQLIERAPVGGSNRQELSR